MTLSGGLLQSLVEDDLLRFQKVKLKLFAKSRREWAGMGITGSTDRHRVQEINGYSLKSYVDDLDHYLIPA